MDMFEHVISILEIRSVIHHYEESHHLYNSYGLFTGQD